MATVIDMQTLKSPVRTPKLSSTYHFPSHSIFSIDNEPLTVCIAEDKLLVATVGHLVEVRRLENRGFVDHTFSTVDLVKQMIYSKTGQYIATLEVKTSRHSLMTHVRLYLNWQVDTKGQPMRARIAGRVTPSSQSGVGQLEMVELPLRKQVCHVSCCQSTGNLAISCGCSVSLFYFCVKVHDISKLQFHDLEHLLEVHLTFPIKEVAICEDFLACMSASELHVIRIDFRCATKEVSWAEIEDEEFMRRRRSSSSVSARSSRRSLSNDDDDGSNVVIDDPHFVDWNCDLSSKQDWELNSDEHEAWMALKSKLHPDSFPLTIRLPSLLQQAVYVDSSNHAMENLGPMEYFPGHPVNLESTGILSLGSDANVYDFKPTSILHRRFSSSALPSSKPFCLHSLQILPLYISTEAADSSEDLPPFGLLQLTLTSSGNPLQSSRHRHLKQLDLFFSTPAEGFLYSLLGDVMLLSKYKYKDPVCHVAIETTVLHAVTAASVETYSVGNWDRILRHFNPVFETDDSLLLALDEQIKLIGFHPFLNVRNAAFGEGHLVLLTDASDGSLSGEHSRSSWTAYALQSPPAEYLYHDLVEERDGASSDSNLFLEHEALIVLGLEVLSNRPSRSSCLVQLFQETCCRVASIYLNPSCSDLNATPDVSLVFYDMSGCSLEFVTKVILDLVSHTSEGDNLEQRRNLANVLALIFVSGKFSRIKSLPKELANDVVKVFAEMDSPHFSMLFLNGFLLGYDPENALNCMNAKLSTNECGTEDFLVACILCLQTDTGDMIPVHFASISDDNLVNVALKYPKIWLKSGHEEAQFSPLFQVVQQLKPEIFVKILQEIISLNLISFKTVQLICQADWEDLGFLPRTDSILLQFLEEFITNKGTKRWHCLEATTTLITLYLKYLANVGPKGTLPLQSKPWSMFGPRRCWLNELPPFRGQSMHGLCNLVSDGGELIATEGTEMMECPCVACNNCLLRLQSLLCSETLASIEVRYHVASAITSAPTLTGCLSLRVLCSPSVSNAIDLLIEQCPSVLLEYGRDVFQKDVSQWQPLLNTLFGLIENCDDDKYEFSSLKTVVNAIVTHLAEFLTPNHLVEILANNKCSTFLPQVRRSIAKLQAKQLHEIIVTKGNELKALV